MYYPLVPVFFAYNEAFKEETISCLASLINYCDKKRLYRIHILYDVMSEDTKKRFEAFSTDNISVCCNDISDKINYVNHKLPNEVTFTKELVYEMIIGEEFPLYNKVIYISLHTDVQFDVSKLFDCTLNNNMIGAFKCHSIDKQNKSYIQKVLQMNPHKYCYSDLLVMNLKQWRKRKLLDRFIDVVHFYSFAKACDQDYINFMTKNKVHYLSNKYELCETSSVPIMTCIYLKKNRPSKQSHTPKKLDSRSLSVFCVEKVNLG